MNKPLKVVARVVIEVDPDAYNAEYSADWTRYDIRDIVKGDIEDALKTCVFAHLIDPNVGPIKSIEVQ